MPRNKTPKPPMQVPFQGPNMLDSTYAWGQPVIMKELPDLTNATLEVLHMSRGRSSMVVAVKVTTPKGDSFNANIASKDFLRFIQGMAFKGTFKPTKRGSRYALTSEGTVEVFHRRVFEPETP